MMNEVALKALMRNANAMPDLGLSAVTAYKASAGGSRSRSRSRSASKKRLKKAKSEAMGALAAVEVDLLDDSAEIDEQDLPSGDGQASASDRRKQFGLHKAATETFHIIEPLVRETRWDIYHGENEEQLEEDHKREMDNLQIEKHARRSIHNHERSSSRARDSSRQARRSIIEARTEMNEINQMRMCYSAAVDNIGAAALKANHGKELTGEGIERVRQEMLGKHGPTNFHAARGAKDAKNDILL